MPFIDRSSHRLHLSSFLALNSLRLLFSPRSSSARALFFLRSTSIHRPLSGTKSTKMSNSFIDLAPTGIFESRALIMQEITAALAYNSNSVVGIHGMGGVGKSTLLVDAEKRIRKEKLFDWIAKTDVSENPDIKRIQGEIAGALGLSDIKDKETVSGRAKLLRERLEKEEREKKKVLIILDNLWERLDLKSVGIPCGYNNKVIGCKLLLTSRFRDLLLEEMGCDRDFLLGGLNEEEAKRLFERTVGEKVHEDPFKSLVDEALRKCVGLPFLIVAMANFFKFLDFSEWKDVLRQIEMSTNKGISWTINEILQLTYDRLKGEDGKEAKSLLRLCVLYGGSKPSIENLVRYSVGLRLFREDSSMEEVRDRLSSLIRTLKASSLLLVDDEDVNGFKIHDLVREFVASIASRGDPVVVVNDNDKLETDPLKNKFKSCNAVGLTYVDVKELPEELDCPEIQIFLLFKNYESFKVPNSFFNSMRKLMVLHLSRVSLTHSPFPFQFSENLHTLCLDGCSLDDVAMIGELKGLNILSFMNSEIHRLPKEIAQLVELRLLDLNNCSLLKIIEPGVLGSLIKLEELYMENSFHGWNVVEQTPPTNASLIELNKMKNLCTLHVSVPDPKMLPADLNVEKLTKYRIQIGLAWFWSSDYETSRALKLKLNPTSNILQKGYIQTILDRADSLFLDGSNGIEHSICNLSPEGFSKLKHLHVENCSSVLYVLQWPSVLAFKRLELLLLENLINLEKICHSHISSGSFSRLKVVRVESCDKMEVLFPLSLVRELPQLEEIGVADCYLMQEIVEADDCGKVELHNLHVLELCDLPSTKNFLNAGTARVSSTLDDQVGAQVSFFNEQQVAFPRLEKLRINGMDSIEMIWDNRVYFQHLRTLNVSYCSGLSNMFTPTIAGNLVELTTLRISNCKMLTEVMSDDGVKERHVVVFNQLKYMKLDGLTRLRCFSSGGYTLNFPLLEDVILTGCHDMKFFSKGPIMAPKLGRLQGSPAEGFWKGNLNITIQNMFEKSIRVAGVEFMRLSEFPELIGKWHSELNPIKSYLQVESLMVDKCKSFINAVPSRLMRVLDTIKSLQVHDCESLEEIFDLEGLEAVESTQVLPCLECLELVYLPKLRQLWNKDLQEMLLFNSLNRLTLNNCSNLRHAFAPSMARCLATVEWMEVKECGQMEGVISEEEGHESTMETITFPKLRWMQLECLPHLTNFLLGKNQMLYCPGLEKLTIAHCPKMKSFTWQSLMEIDYGNPSLFTLQVQFPRLKSMLLSHMDSLCKIWTDGPQETLAFKHLREVEVQNCKSLENLFPHWLAASLNQLEVLQVEFCMIEEIVRGDDTSHFAAAKVIFPKLTSLVLCDMPRLKSFCPNLPALSWPFLKNKRVTHCGKLSLLGK